MSDDEVQSKKRVIEKEKKKYSKNFDSHQPSRKEHFQPPATTLNRVEEGEREKERTRIFFHFRHKRNHTYLNLRYFWCWTSNISQEQQQQQQQQHTNRSIKKVKKMRALLLRL